MIRDDVPKLLTDIAALVKREVLVGIPESKTDRGSNEPTNAMIGYVMETGSPANNVPARPHLVPGVTNSLPAVIPHLQAAADATLAGNKSKADQELHAAGLIASSSVKRYLDTASFVPLKPSTIRNRYRQRRTQTRNQSETHYLKLISQGMSPAAAQVATGIQPLLNTGEYRNSITYVVRNRR